MPDRNAPGAAGNQQDLFSLELHAAVSAIGDLVYVFDESARYVYVNQALLDLWGLTYEEAVGKHIHELLGDDALATHVVEQIKTVIETGESIVDETQYTSPTGTTGYYEYILRPFRNGLRQRVVGTTRDITDRKRLEMEVSTRHERLTEILESITDGFYALDADWRFTYVNQRAAEVMQRSREELLSRNVWEEYPDLIGSDVHTHFQRAMLRQAPESFEFYYDPLKTWFQVYAHPSSATLSVYLRDIGDDIRIRRELSTSENRNRRLNNAMPQMVWITDNLGRHIFYNDRWYEYTGLSVEDSLDFGFANALHPDDYDRTMEAWQRAWKHGETYEIEYRFYSRALQQYRWFLGRAAPVLDEEGQITEWVGTCTDIQLQKDVEAKLIDSEQRLANAQRIAKVGYWELDLVTGAFSCSDEHKRIHGLDPADPNVDLNVLIELIHPDDRSKVKAASDYVIAHGGAYNIEYRIFTPAGEERHIHTLAETAPSPDSAPQRLGGSAQDITDQKAIRSELERYASSQEQLLQELFRLNETLEVQVSARTEELRQLTVNLERIVEERTAELEHNRAELAHRVKHDMLTGLPNRLWFEEELTLALSTAARNCTQVAVLFIDLDGFKLANDSMGHSAGDQILRMVAGRLHRQVPETGMIARHSGDEFIAVLNAVETRHDVLSVARSILSAVGRPFAIEGRTAQLSASIGIALFPEHSSNSADLLRQADVAMYRAKATGKNDVRFYEAEMSAEAEDRLQIAVNLSGALERSEFYLHFQPQWNAGLRRFASVEALLRWDSPVLGAVSPARMIPIAEESGLIIEIGAWVLDESCRQAARWTQVCGEQVSVAVNVAASQLDRDDFVDLVARSLQTHGLQPAQLELELTERSVMQDTELAKSRMIKLRALGVRIAMDDFGLGSSSLSNLVHLPLDTVKIDRGFTREIPGHAPSDRVIQAIVALAQALDLDVVAEGVENIAQFNRVAELGCGRVQGYLLGRPSESHTLDVLLAQQHVPFTHAT